jgi:hypothetical protein
VDEDRRREIGLFRYALVRDAADAALSKAERGRLVRALADREHMGPDGRLVRVARGTLDEWVRAYRRGGFEALVPRPRVVAPRTPVQVLELAFRLKRERPERTAAQVRAIMLAAGGARSGVAHVADASRAGWVERSRGWPFAREGVWPLRSERAQRAVDRGWVARPDARWRGGSAGGAVGVHR